MNFKEQFISEYCRELRHRQKQYEKYKLKFDRFQQELSKCVLQVQVFEKKLTQLQKLPIRIKKSKLDVGIIKGLLSQNQLFECNSSYGQNSIFYSVTQGQDLFKSERVTDQLRMPVWNETFTFTIEDGKETLVFEILRHNSSEKDLQIDQFEVLLTQHLEQLKDQINHQITVTTEKENAFVIVMRWRYEETGLKVIQLKKKIQQIQGKLKQEENSLKESKDLLDRLLNFKGNGKQLLEIWKVDEVVEDIMSPDRRSTQSRQDSAVRKRPLAKLSSAGSRSNSIMNDSSNCVVLNSQIIDSNNITNHSRNESISSINQGSSNKRSIRHPLMKQGSGSSNAIPTQSQNQQNYINFSKRDPVTHENSQRNTRLGSPVSLKFGSSAGSPSTNQSNNQQIPQKFPDPDDILKQKQLKYSSPKSFLGSSVQAKPSSGSKTSLNSATAASLSKGFLGRINTQQLAKQTTLGQTKIKVPPIHQRGKNSIDINKNGVHHDQKGNTANSDNHQIKEKATIDHGHEKINKPGHKHTTSKFANQKVTAKDQNKAQSTNKDQDQEHKDSKQDKQARKGSFTERKTEIDQEKMNDKLQGTDLVQEKNKEQNTDKQQQPIMFTKKGGKPQKAMHEFNMQDIQKQSPKEEPKPVITEISPGIIQGSICFEETRKDELLRRKEREIFMQKQQEMKVKPFKSQLTSSKPQHVVENDESQNNQRSNEKTYKSDESKIDLSKISGCQNSYLDKANNEQQNNPIQSNQSYIDDLQKQIEMVMMEAETENQQKQPSANQQFKVGNNKPKGVNQGFLSDFNSPDMRLKKHQMNQQQMLNSSGGNESLLSGSIQNEHNFPLNNDPVFSENSGEILEPTMKNLKRLELKNQRKDLQASLASSTIDNLLNMRSNPGSVYNDPVLGQPQQPQYLNHQQMPKIGNQPIKFGGSMRGSMFGYGSMGIGQMMKSMEGGALMSRQALIKNLDQNKNDDLRSFGDTSSQGGMIPNEIETNLVGGNKNTDQVQSHVLNNNPAGFGFFFKGMYTRPASLYNYNINNNNH